MPQRTEAIEKFYAIKEEADRYHQSRQEFAAGKLREHLDPKTMAHMALADAYGKSLRKIWGDKWGDKADDIDNKSGLLERLKGENESKNITDNELQEIFNSAIFQDYISTDDIVLIAKEHSKEWGNSQFLKQIKQYRDRAVKTDVGFVGRHQEVIAVKELLGEIVTPAEKEQAFSEDAQERNQILERLQDLETYFNSDLFVAHEGSHLTQVSETIRSIIDEGFDLCVLQNDRELDQRCFKILLDVEAHMKDKILKAAAEGKTTPEQVKQWEQLPDLVSIKGFFTWLDLGNPSLTKNGDMQQAWVMLATLRQPKKQIGLHNADNYLSQIIGSARLNDLESFVNRYKTVKARLLANHKLTEQEGQIIDSLIVGGVEMNRKIHEQYPDRP
jgi:hypothetical protein